MKVFHLGENPQELPEDFLVRRGYLEDNTEVKARQEATEISPGVWVAVLGVGHTITPDHRNSWGATIMVWTEP